MDPKVEVQHLVAYHIMGGAYKYMPTVQGGSFNADIYTLTALRVLKGNWHIWFFVLFNK